MPPRVLLRTIFLVFLLLGSPGVPSSLAADSAGSLTPIESDRQAQAMLDFAQNEISSLARAAQDRFFADISTATSDLFTAAATVGLPGRHRSRTAYKLKAAIVSMKDARKRGRPEDEVVTVNCVFRGSYTVQPVRNRDSGTGDLSGAATFEINYSHCVNDSSEASLTFDLNGPARVRMRRSGDGNEDVSGVQLGRLNGESHVLTLIGTQTQTIVAVDTSNFVIDGKAGKIFPDAVDFLGNPLGDFSFTVDGTAEEFFLVGLANGDTAAATGTWTASAFSALITLSGEPPSSVRIATMHGRA